MGSTELTFACKCSSHRQLPVHYQVTIIANMLHIKVRA